MRTGTLDGMFRRPWIKFLWLPLLPWLSGCAYLHDRVRDAGDMVTVAVEGFGVNAAVGFGPGTIGLGAASGKGFGLRSGVAGVYGFSELNLWPCFNSKTLLPHESDSDRDKGYETEYAYWLFREDGDSDEEYAATGETGGQFNNFQLELALHLGVGARAGINLMEIVDFILGWTTYDVCGDDAALQEAREQRAARNVPPDTELLPPPTWQPASGGELRAP